MLSFNILVQFSSFSLVVAKWSSGKPRQGTGTPTPYRRSFATWGTLRLNQMPVTIAHIPSLGRSWLR